MNTFTFNELGARLPSDEEQRLYARDLAMLSVTGAIISAMEAAGITRAGLADRIGRSEGFVSQVLSGSRDLTLATLADVLWALGKEMRGLEVRPVGGVCVGSDGGAAAIDQ
ncbi:MAG TPA: helix-turn-helix transcriptional regulator [Gemmatimonadaceae bacterium]|nr:helix-turn-helix transcriptional regulator [Gemmatimonadaceae bacterium]